MDMGQFNLFIKMIRDEYKLSENEIFILRNRLLADDKEFEKTWGLYKNKAKSFSKGVDEFKNLLSDLVS